LALTILKMERGIWIMSEQLLREIVAEMKRMNNGYQELAAEVRDLTSEVRDLRVSHQELAAEVRDLRVSHQELAAEVRDLRVSHQGLLVSHQELTLVVRAVRENQEVTNAKLDALISETRKLSDGQERHEKILQSLTMRSLEQETEIRELRRFKWEAASPNTPVRT
jgi:uncharacterized coiled-coil DUF342 family protein